MEVKAYERQALENSKGFSLMLEASQLEKARKRAKEEGKSVSNLIRDAITLYLKIASVES